MAFSSSYSDTNYIRKVSQYSKIVAFKGHGVGQIARVNPAKEGIFSNYITLNSAKIKTYSGYQVARV